MNADVKVWFGAAEGNINTHIHWYLESEVHTNKWSDAVECTTYYYILQSDDKLIGMMEEHQQQEYVEEGG